eukprot:gene43410-53068_t
MEVLEGVIKWQSTDKEGHYVWQRMRMRLHTGAGLCSLTDDSGQTTQMSLAGAQFAKEWSFSSVMGGFGFDIVWSNGNISSVLTDDQRSCSAWVNAFSNVISLLKTHGRHTEAPSILPTSLPQPPRPNPSSSAAISSALSQGLLPTSLPGPVGVSAPKTFDEAKGEVLPPHPLPRYAADTPAELREPGQELPGSRSAYVESMKDLFSATKSQMQRLGGNVPAAPFSPKSRYAEPAASATAATRGRDEDERAAHRESAEADRGDDGADGGELAWLRRELASVKERERLLALQGEREVERRVLRLSNENVSFYEASVRALKLQHEREVSSLRDELLAERTRHAQDMERERGA